ncbi:MAG TPA: CoA-binding protein [Bacteroidales bacterium]|nr:CoA-binding protein [Bacteroidales bacterium]
MKDIINSFINDNELALAGVSAKREKWGNALFRALTKKGYTVYPINPKLDEVEGVKCYRSVSELPDSIENLILATPPEATEQIVKDCKDTAIKRIWMHRGGGGTGAQTDNAIEFVKDNNMQVVYGLCPMMFYPPVGIHKLHYWMKKLSKKMPSTYSE